MVGLATFFHQESSYIELKSRIYGVERVIFFDGVCNLCNWSVKFIIKHDKKENFYFSSLQSDFAHKYLLYVNGQHIKYDSLIYMEGDILFTRSEAVLKILKLMGGGWKLFYIFKIIPKSWRDKLYDFIAAHRYGWFGKSNKCMAPTPDTIQRFID